MELEIYCKDCKKYHEIDLGEYSRRDFIIFTPLDFDCNLKNISIDLYEKLCQTIDNKNDLENFIMCYYENCDISILKSIADDNHGDWLATLQALKNGITIIHDLEVFMSENNINVAYRYDLVGSCNCEGWHVIPHGNIWILLRGVL